jgi:hypothetical protein
MVPHYESWSRWYSLRSQIHDRGLGTAERIRALWTTAFDGGYRPKTLGGFGKKSLVKDGAAAVGVVLDRS